MRRVGGAAALTPARQGSLRIEVERDHPFARARRRNSERGCERGFSRSAFLSDECNRAHRESRYTRLDSVTESGRCKVTTPSGCVGRITERIFCPRESEAAAAPDNALHLSCTSARPLFRPV